MFEQLKGKLLFKVIVLFLGLFFFRVLISWGLPITQDEAYYSSWSKFLDFGYFDHPPGVAIWAMSGLISPSSALSVRFINILMSVLASFFSYQLFKIAMPNDKRALWAAVLLLVTNLGFLLSGVLTTPDSIIGLAWVWCLKESLQALKGDGRRWLIAGVATGVGLLGKYTMLLIGPVFLLGLIKINPSQFRTKWPYLGGIMALLVFLPNLMWNVDNDWATWKFQLKHGFSLERGEAGEQLLPDPLDFLEGSDEDILSLPFKSASKKSLEKKEPKPKKSPVEKSIQRVGDFIGGQLALWGALIPFALIFLWRLVFRRRELKADFSSLDSQSLRYFAFAALVPLIVFCLISIVSKVEGNWAAMYIYGAAPFLAVIVKKYPRIFYTGVVANLLLLGIVALHANYEFGRSKGKSDRILSETHGYKKLAGLVENERLVFADSYQIVSMLQFYNGDANIFQWPGITRTSQFIANKTFVEESFQLIKKYRNFVLITTNKTPPRIPGYAAVSMRQVRDCPGEQFDVIEADDLMGYKKTELCKKPIHVWHEVQYFIL